jgi:hypothetical protein
MPGFAVVEELEGFIPQLQDRLPDSYLFEGLDLTGTPTFTTKEVSSIFFQHSTGWLRWREGQQVREVKAEDGSISYQIRNRPPGTHPDDSKPTLSKKEEREAKQWKRLFQIPLRDGEGGVIPPLEPERDASVDNNGTRRYTLADIEMLAYRFRALNAISTSRMLITLNILALIAYGYNLINPEGQE